MLSMYRNGALNGLGCCGMRNSWLAHKNGSSELSLLGPGIMPGPFPAQAVPSPANPLCRFACSYFRRSYLLWSHSFTVVDYSPPQHISFVSFFLFWQPSKASMAGNTILMTGKHSLFRRWKGTCGLIAAPCNPQRSCCNDGGERQGRPKTNSKRRANKAARGLRYIKLPWLGI